MKFIPGILVLLFIYGAANVQSQEQKAFEIPRSKVLEIEDPSSKRVYPLFIKLPRSYYRNDEKSYPVIYLTDALYSFQIVSGATRFPMNSGKMQEAIIVGISYSKGSRGSSSRIRDFTHVEDPDWEYQTGKAKAHMQFIERSVFPFIENKYRVNQSRTFVGNSLGGLFGAYILFTNPGMFDNYILGSPSAWYKDNNILGIKTDINLNPHKVFIAVGARETPEYDSPRHDMVNGARELKAKISAPLFPNTEVKLLTIQEANHETAFPTTAIQGLYWMLKKS